MKVKTDEIVFLKGKKVNLRPPMEEDLPLLLKWINDPDINQYLSTYLPKMEEDEREWLSRVQKDKPQSITLIIVADGNPIGVMRLHNVDFRNRTARTGALIGDKEYWGKGYGTEAKMILLNYAFNTLNLRKISSSVFEFNKRSYAYSIKCGYKKEGVRREQVFKDGKYHDEILLAVFQEEWAPVWEEYKKKYKL